MIASQQNAPSGADLSEGIVPEGEQDRTLRTLGCMLTFKPRNLDPPQLAPSYEVSRNQKVAHNHVAPEWCPFADEPGGKLKFHEQQGVSLELHLLHDPQHFLPVWLLDGVVVAMLDAAEA
jgi:hypothetical protein